MCQFTIPIHATHEHARARVHTHTRARARNVRHVGIFSDQRASEYMHKRE